jgi:hypothetical protein
MRLIHFKSRKRHRRNPSRRHRGHARRYRRNPAALKQILNPTNFMQIGSVTVGFVAGAKVGGMIYNKFFGTGPGAKVRRFAGLVTFALGTFAAGKVRNDNLKKAAAGLAAAGIYDLIAQNIPQAGLKPVNGETISVRGVDLVGNDPAEDDDMEGETISVSGDMTELVGDEMDGDRIYAA